MLFIIRTVFILFYTITVCLFGIIYCLFNIRNPNNVATFGHTFGHLAPLLGLKVEIRKPEGAEKFCNVIYIANHQNIYDMVTISNIVPPKTITVGKKSLLWIPLFGQLYWLTGNILIDRKNRLKSYDIISKVINYFKKSSISIWIFPEGTRSQGKGLLTFKTGAFHIAIATGAPIIPICVSNTTNKISLNRLNNGLVIVEMLSPINVDNYKKSQVKELTNYCHKLMTDKIDKLNKEVEKRENTKK